LEFFYEYIVFPKLLHLGVEKEGVSGPFIKTVFWGIYNSMLFFIETFPKCE